MTTIGQAKVAIPLELIASRDLMPADKFLWIFVRWRSREGVASLTQSEIAEALNVSVRGVQLSVARLVSAGWLKVLRRGVLMVEFGCLEVAR